MRNVLYRLPAYLQAARFSRACWLRVCAPSVQRRASLRGLVAAEGAEKSLLRTKSSSRPSVLHDASYITRLHHSRVVRTLPYRNPKSGRTLAALDFASLLDLFWVHSSAHESRLKQQRRAVSINFKPRPGCGSDSSRHAAWQLSTSHHKLCKAALQQRCASCSS